MVAAVFRPAVFGMFGAQRQLLAIADSRHTVSRDAQRLQIVLGGLRALGAKSDIVFLRTAFVAMAFDLNVAVRIFLQPVGIVVQNLAILRAHGLVIVTKMDLAQRPLFAAAELAFLELAQ